MIYKRAGIMEKVNQRGKYLFIAGIISLIIAIVILFIIPDPSANNVEIAKRLQAQYKWPKKFLKTIKVVF